MQQAPHPERITMRTIWQGVLDIFNLERGLVQTTLTLTRRPGHAIREYLLTDRDRLMPPFRFMIFMVAIATFITVQYFNTVPDWMSELNQDFKAGYDQGAQGLSEKDVFFKNYSDNLKYLFNNYFNLFILAGLPISALATQWFFRRRFNYAEHLVINSYVTGYLTVVYIVLSLMLLFTSFVTLSGIYTILTFLYSVVVYRQVYQSPGVRGVMASIGAVLVYFLIYYILVIIFLISLMVIGSVRAD